MVIFLVNPLNSKTFELNYFILSSLKGPFKVLILFRAFIGIGR